MHAYHSVAFRLGCVEVAVPLRRVDIPVPLGHIGSAVPLCGVDIMLTLGHWLIGVPICCVLIKEKRYALVE